MIVTVSLGVLQTAAEGAQFATDFHSLFSTVVAMKMMDLYDLYDGNDGFRTKNDGFFD